LTIALGISLGKGDDQKTKSYESGYLLEHPHVNLLFISSEANDFEGHLNFVESSFLPLDDSSPMAQIFLNSLIVNKVRHKLEWTKIYCGDWTCVVSSKWDNCVVALPKTPQSLSSCSALVWWLEGLNSLNGSYCLLIGQFF